MAGRAPEDGKTNSPKLITDPDMAAAAHQKKVRTLRTMDANAKCQGMMVILMQLTARNNVAWRVRFIAVVNDMEVNLQHSLGMKRR